ncbi:MAG: hypothetical protein OXH94_09075 [Rhodospirillales bacterium]|nr:hypothetical protein [Rhodospirillales bacterium]
MGVHKGLVALVIGMAVLIGAGLIAVAWGLVSKSGDAGLSGTAGGGPAGSFGDVDVPLADGESILSALPSAGRVVVHIQSREGPERLVILDPVTGGITGQFTFKAPQAAPGGK